MARLNEDRATRYHRSRLRSRLGGDAAAFLVLALSVPAGPSLARAVTSATWHVPAAWLAATVLLTASILVAVALARLPFDVYADWTLARRYALERLSLASWLRRHAREAVIGGLLICGAAILARAAFALSGDWGWMIAAVALWMGHLTWSLVLPAMLARSGALRPLDAPLRDRLTELGTRVGVPLDVRQWHAGGARQAQAIVVGLGRQRRVILSDTLVETLSHDELEVVVAHELAHQIHGDVWRAAAWRLLVLLAGFGAAAGLLPRLVSPGTASIDLAALPALGLIVQAIAALARPAGLALSRRHERRADAFALDETRNPDAFVRSMRRLAAHNLIDERPTPLSRLLSSHPTVRDRVRAIERHKARETTSAPRARRASGVRARRVR